MVVLDGRIVIILSSLNQNSVHAPRSTSACDMQIYKRIENTLLVYFSEGTPTQLWEKCLPLVLIVKNRTFRLGLISKNGPFVKVLFLKQDLIFLKKDLK
jgi:hypothetical protein